MLLLLLLHFYNKTLKNGNFYIYGKYKLKQNRVIREREREKLIGHKYAQKKSCILRAHTTQ